MESAGYGCSAASPGMSLFGMARLRAELEAIVDLVPAATVRHPSRLRRDPLHLRRATLTDGLVFDAFRIQLLEVGETCMAHAGIDSVVVPSVKVTVLAAIPAMRGPGRMMPVRFSGSAALMLTVSPA